MLDYLADVWVKQNYDPDAPTVNFADLAAAFGESAAMSLLLGAVPREVDYQANRAGKGDFTTHSVTNPQEAHIDPSQKEPSVGKNSTDTVAEYQNKPYAKSRPRYAKGQEEAVWEIRKSALDGKVYDPSGAEILWDRSKPRNGQWDMGHIPGEKYSVKHKQYMEGKMTLQEFLDWYRDPKNYRPELPKTNRSHKYE